MRWDDDLEGAALRIAGSDADPLRVVAGPGTGKTFSQMRRVTRFLQEGIEPGRIFVCTFTRTAARDLQKSLKELGVDGATDVQAGTLHSYCFSLLAREEVFEATARVPRPLLKQEERFLVQDLKTQFGGVHKCNKRLKAFNAAWARLQSEEPGWPADPVDRQFEVALGNWLRFHRAMLIGELVPVALQFLRDNPANAALTSFDESVVDEFQDLNRAEQTLLDLLASKGHLTIVGDEDQSIYSFKHAHPEGIREFADRHPGTHDESLDECRRCPQLIVDMANDLIGQNACRQPRTLAARKENPTGEVHVIQWANLEAEAGGIARFVQDRIATGRVEPGKVLILAPRRQFAYAIRDALLSLEVPAHSFFQEEALDGNPQKVEGCQAQKSYSLLNLVADPNDRVALRCWCGFGSPSLRSGAWHRLRAHCEDSGQSPREALEAIVEGVLSIAHCQGLVNRYHELQQRLAVLVNLKGQELVDALFPEAEDWAEQLRTAAETVQQDDVGPVKLREAVRTAISQPELPVDVDYVRLMSLHKSKGLTADLVVVAGCIEGLIPAQEDSDLSLAEQRAALEEQRRLFYVAITRARETLVLSSVTSLPRKLAHKMRARVGGGKQAKTISSRFLRELGLSKPAPVTGTQFLVNQGLD